MAREKHLITGVLPFLVLGLLIVCFFGKLILNFPSIFWPFGDTVHSNFLYEGILRKALENFSQAPLWNNLIFSGVPYMGNPVLPFYYPFNLLLLLLPKNLLFGYTMVFHTFLAGAFTYLFARQLSLSKKASFISAISFAFSSALVGKFYPGHAVNLIVISLVPLVFYMLEKVIKNPDIKHTLLFGLVWALQLVAGFLQYFYFISISLLFYFVFRLAMEYNKDKNLQRASRIVLYVGLSLLVCILLSAFYLLPVYEMSQTTIRQGGLDYEAATQFSLPPKQAITFLIPDFFGSVVDQTYWGEWDNNWALQVYSGILPMVLAAFGLLFVMGRRREVVFFLVSSLFWIIFAFGKYTPLYRFFYLYMPGTSYFRVPAEQLFLFCFSVAVLAGFGANYLLTTSKAELRRRAGGLIRLLWIASLVCVLLGIAVVAFRPAILSYGASIAEERYMRLHPGEQDFEQNYLPKIEKVYGHISQGTLWFSILLLLSTFAVWLSGTRLRKTWLFVLFAAIIIMDLWAYGLPQINVKDPAELYRPDELTDFLKSDSSHYRVYDLSGFVYQYLLPEYGIESITGYDIFIQKDYVLFTNLIGNLSGQIPSNLPIEYLAPSEIKDTRILDLLNVKYLITEDKAELPGFELALEREGFMAERDYDTFKQYSNRSLDLYIYENKNVLPRAYLIGTAKSASSHQDALAGLMSPDFDPNKYIIIEKELPEGHTNSAVLKEVEIGYYSPNRIALNLTTDKPTFLVLSETYYPGWRAYDNGKETEIFRTDYLLRSVWLDKGDHQLEFKFIPRNLEIGLDISFLTLAAVILLILIPIFPRDQ